MLVESAGKVVGAEVGVEHVVCEGVENSLEYKRQLRFSNLLPSSIA